MAWGIRIRRGVVAVLVASMLGSGCASHGGRVVFAEPEGGSVRIGIGFAHTIPWETHLSVGEHSVVLSPNGRSGFLGLSPGEDAIRGRIVVLDSWEGGVAVFSPSPRDLEDAAAGREMTLYGTSPVGLGGFRFKGSREGVPSDDPEVADWRAHADLVLSGLPPSGFVGGLAAVGKATLQVLFLIFLFWLELEDDDEEEECY